MNHWVIAHICVHKMHCLHDSAVKAVCFDCKLEHLEYSFLSVIRLDSVFMDLIKIVVRGIKSGIGSKLHCYTILLSHHMID